VREVVEAFGKAGRDLLRAEIIWQAVWPPLVAMALWTVVAFSVWAHALVLMTGLVPELAWSGWANVAHWAAVFLLLAAFAALVYFTAMLLVAVFALPRMLSLVAAREFPDLARRGENPFWGSLGNTLASGAVFIVGWLVTLPLLLVPGVVLVLPLFWAAWLNQRVFRFDSLVEHASRNELAAVVATERSRMYLAGVGSALTAHLPVVNLLAPAFTALVYVHLCLGALRRHRLERGIEV
jgi:hypothetical protein